jgi:hypothetical protein
LGGYSPENWQSGFFTILRNDSPQDITGTFAGLDDNALIHAGNSVYRIHYNWSGIGGNGNDIVLESLPEPSGMTVLALFGSSMALRRRRMSI